MADHRPEARGHFQPVGISQDPRQHASQGALADVQREHEGRGRDADGPKDVGHPRPAAAEVADVDASEAPRYEQAEGYRAQQVSDDDGEAVVHYWLLLPLNRILSGLPRNS